MAFVERVTLSDVRFSFSIDVEEEVACKIKEDESYRNSVMEQLSKAHLQSEIVKSSTDISSPKENSPLYEHQITPGENAQHCDIDTMAFPSSSNKEQIVDKDITVNQPDDFHWTPDMVKLLIHERGSDEVKFANPLMKKKKLWERIAMKLNAVSGSKASGSNCDTKWRNLTKRYRMIKDRLSTSGHSNITWEYFTEIDDILKRKLSTVPPADRLFSSITPCESATASPTPSISDLSSNLNDNGSNSPVPDVALSPNPSSQGSNNSTTTGSQRKRKDQAPTWFLEYVACRAEQERKDREELKRQWDEQKEIELQKIEAFKELTNAIREFSKK